MVRIAVNGFGRIGRLVTRIAIERPDTTIVAANEIHLDIAQMAYLFKYDSIHGVWKGEVTHTDTHLVIRDESGENEVKIKVFKEETPDKIPWEQVKAEVICESTGVFRQKARALEHIRDGNGVETVVVSAPL